MASRSILVQYRNGTLQTLGTPLDMGLAHVEVKHVARYPDRRARPVLSGSAAQEADGGCWAGRDHGGLSVADRARAEDAHDPRAALDRSHPWSSDLGAPG